MPVLVICEYYNDLNKNREIVFFRCSRAAYSVLSDWIDLTDPYFNECPDDLQG